MKFGWRGRVLGILLLVCLAAVFTVLVQSEPSRGNLTLRFIAKDTQEPLADARVMIYDSKTWRTLSAVTDKHGNCQFIHITPDNYTISVSEKSGYSSPEGTVKVTEGTHEKQEYTLVPLQPHMEMTSPNECFLPNKPVELRVSGVTAKPKGEMVVYQMHGWLLDEYRKQGDRLKSVAKEILDQSDPQDDSVLTVVRRSPLVLHQRHGSGSFNHRLPIEPLNPGIYAVTAKTGDVRRPFIFVVTKLGLVMKYARNSAAIYCVDMTTGKPMPDVALSVTDNGTTRAPGIERDAADGHLRLLAGEDGAVVASAKANKSGLYQFTLTENNQPRRLTVSGKIEDQIAICTPESSLDTPHSDPYLRGNVVFDRPVYRPGQKVYYKFFAREVIGSRGLVPSNTTAMIRIMDSSNAEIWSGQKQLSSWGTLAGEFAIPEWVQPGSCSVDVTMGGNHFSGSVVVREYRKPEYTVTMVPSRQRLVQGEQLSVKVQVRTFYGTPVPKAKVTLSYDTYEETGTLFGLNMNRGSNNLNGEIKGQTDASGDVEFKLNTNLTKLFPASTLPPADYELSLYASVQHGNQSEYAMGNVQLVQGDYELQINSDQQFCAKHQSMHANISAVTYDGKKVPSVSGQVEVQLFELSNDGLARPHTIKRADWKTGASGEADLSVPTDVAGDIMITVTSSDTHGRMVVSHKWFYVMPDEEPIDSKPYTEFSLIADKEQYKIGDTAKVLIRASSAVKAAMICEEGQEVKNARVVELVNGGAMITVPITKEMMPGIAIGAVAVNKTDLVQTQQVLKIDRKPQKLKVSVTPKQPVLSPGQTASVSIRTTDTNGKPVAAEVCLGAVDEAIYSVQPDDTLPMEDVLYPDVVDNVMTTCSFDTYYYSGDAKSEPNRMRQRFRDTAYWNPTITTNDAGLASVSFTLPDNLTTWRLTARALAKDAQSGQAVGYIEVTKRLITRLDAPRFLLQGDTAVLMAVVQNNSKQAITAATKVVLSGADDRTIERTLSIAAGDISTMPVQVQANHVGKLHMQISAKAGKHFDGVISSIDVLPRAMRTSRGFNMGLGSSDIVSLKLSPDDVILPNALTLRVSPSLAGALTGGLQFLKNYPYGCVEQTTSSFLPALISHDLQQRMGLPEDAELKRITMMGTSRLASMANYDLTWGWWEYGPSDAWMSAYALFGIMQAKAVGWSAESYGTETSCDGLAELSKAKGFDARQTLVAYVLAKSDKYKPLAADLLKRLPSLRKPQPNSGQWAIAALAWKQLGDESNAASAYKQAMQQLARLGNDWSSSRVEQLGCLLWAGSELKVPAMELRPLLDQLSVARRSEGWYSTRDTAFALIGLSRYMMTYGELQGDRSAAIMLNGKLVYSRSFSQSELFKPEAVIRPLVKSKNGEVALNVHRKGAVSISGELAVLDTAMQPSQIRGLQITRTITPEQGKPQRDSSIKQGRIYRVTIKLTATRNLQNLMVECPIPAGMEPLDRGKLGREEWSYWWDDQVYGEREVDTAVRWLDKGSREVSFVLKASTCGRFTMLPVVVYDMYNPQIRANTTPVWVEIK